MADSTSTLNERAPSSEQAAGPHDSSSLDPRRNAISADRILDIFRQHGTLGVTIALLFGFADFQQGFYGILFRKLWPRVAHWLRRHPRISWILGVFLTTVSFARFVPDAARVAWLWLMNHALANITIERDDSAHYDSVMAFILSKSDLSTQRSMVSYSADFLKNRRGIPFLGEEKVIYQGHLGNMQIFSHNGQRFAVTLGDTSESTQIRPASFRGDIKIWRFGLSRTHPWWSPEPIKRLINQIVEESEEAKKNTETKVFKAFRDYWEPQAPCLARSMESVTLDASVKAKLMDDLDRFLHPDAAQWHQERGIEYRRGYLFWGKPGCGKTSMVRAIASHFGLSIYTISLLDQSIDDANLLELFQKLGKGDIVLLEDIDCAGLLDRDAQRTLGVYRERNHQYNEEDVYDSSEAGNTSPDSRALTRSSKKRKQKSSRQRTRTPRSSGNAELEDSSECEEDTRSPEPLTRVTVSGLLNAIDGISSSHGHILIMTSNHPEVLDEALTRPGRVQQKVHFDYCSKVMVRDIFQFFYHPVSIERCPYDLDSIPILAEKFATIIPDGKLSPAQVQQYLLIHQSNPSDAVEGVENWLEELTASQNQEAESKLQMIRSLPRQSDQ